MSALILTPTHTDTRHVAGEPHDASASGSRLRLTRRGRLVISTFVLLMTGALLAVVAMLGSTHAQASDAAAGATAEFGYVVVQPGESLWGVATTLDASADPRDVIAEIVRLNQLGGSEVQAGQPIAVPLRYSDAPGVISASELGLASEL